MNNNTNDDNPSHFGIKQVSVVNAEDELKKDRIASGADGDDSVLGGDSPADDFGDSDPTDPDAGGVLDIDNARAAMGERNDGDWEHRNELTAEDLNLNAQDDVSTPRTTEPDELDNTD